MTRYFIPKDTEPDTAVAGVRRMTVYAYSGDSAPIPDYCDEVQLVPADAIVIRREELPEVRRDGDVLHCGSVAWPVNLAHKYRDGSWQDALQSIALVEYLREHPPVDEARVKALADAFMAAGMSIVTLNGMTVQDYARRLLDLGVTAPEVTP